MLSDGADVGWFLAEPGGCPELALVSLRGGLSRHASLQAAWKDHGETALSLEVLEKFDDDLSPLLLNQQLSDRKKVWAAELGAEIL